MSIHLESEITILVPVDFAWVQSIEKYLYQLHPDVTVSKVDGYPNLERQLISVVNNDRYYMHHGVERLVNHSEKTVYARRFGDEIKYSTTLWVYMPGQNLCETYIWNIQDVELEPEAIIDERDYKKIMEQSINDGLTRVKQYLEASYI